MTTLAVPVCGSSIKGSGFVEIVRWIERTRGKDGLLELHARMAKPWQDLADPSRASLGILIGSWYPAEFLHAIYDAMTEGLAQPQRSKLSQRAAEAYVEAMLSGVYRLLFSMFVSPERYAANLPRMWHQNWSDGDAEATIVGDDVLEVALRNWKGHHPFGCELVYHVSVIMLARMGYGVEGQYACKEATGADICSARIGYHRAAQRGELR